MVLSIKHYYWRWLKNLFILFICSLLMMSIARLGFTFFFGDIANIIQDPSFRTAMLLGVRFDIIPLCYINALPFIFLNFAYLLPGKLTIKTMRVFLISFLLFGYSVLGWIYICDYGFYSYFQDHINILFFGFFEDDTQALLTSIWKNYNLVLWLSLVGLAQYGFYRILKFLFSPFDFDIKIKTSGLKTLFVFALGCVLMAWGGRGSFTRVPLSFEDAHVSKNGFINKISLNGVISLNRAFKIRKMFGTDQVNYLENYGYGEDWKTAFSDAFGRSPGPELMSSLIHKTKKNESAQKNPPHVILIVMESFGSYWNEKNSEDFQILGELNRHFREDILFKNFLSAENGTIGSIVAVATSQLTRPGARFLSESEFINTPLRSSGHLPFKEAGYETHFVYGGKLGWRDLGRYLQTQKYDNLWGAEEMKESLPELNQIQPQDLGNEWGIFDEYLFTFIEEQLRTASKPQFFLVLTTSNHPPFEYPGSYRPKQLKLTDDFLSQLTVDKDLATKRFLGLQYANQKTGEFITRLKKSRLKDNVAIAITGDHSYWIAKNVGLEQEFKRYAVPFYMYLPSSLRPLNYDKDNFGSHEDIFPTLYNAVLSEVSYVRLGEDLLNGPGYATNSSGIAASKEGSYHHGEFWVWKNLVDQQLERSNKTDLSKIKKHMDGLISITDLYLKTEKTRTSQSHKENRP